MKYEPFGGMRQARTGFHRWFANYSTIPTYFKEGEVAKTTQELFERISRCPSLSELVPKEGVEIPKEVVKKIAMRSTDGVISGAYTYFPPMHPNPDYPLSMVCIEFNFSSTDEACRERYNLLRSIVDNWRDKKAYNVSFGPM